MIGPPVHSGIVNPARILLVEDEQTLRDMLRASLEREGWEVMAVADAQAGDAAVDAFSPDVAILDIKLPDMLGWDLCKKIKSNPETAQVKVLELSATLASAEDRAVSVLVWNYHDDDLPTAVAPVDLTINGLPPELHRRLIMATMLVCGMEALVAARDACGLEPDEATEVMRWAAQALLQVALRDST